MNREQILDHYSNRNGTIEDIGRFEGQPIYTPYFWDLACSEYADDVENGPYLGDCYIFHLSPEDKEMFPELQSFTTLKLWEDKEGVVNVETE